MTVLESRSGQPAPPAAIGDHGGREPASTRPSYPTHVTPICRTSSGSSRLSLVPGFMDERGACPRGGRNSSSDRSKRRSASSRGNSRSSSPPSSPAPASSDPLPSTPSSASFLSPSGTEAAVVHWDAAAAVTVFGCLILFFGGLPLPRLWNVHDTPKRTHLPSCN